MLLKFVMMLSVRISMVRIRIFVRIFRLKYLVVKV